MLCALLLVLLMLAAHLDHDVDDEHVDDDADADEGDHQAERLVEGLAERRARCSLAVVAASGRRERLSRRVAFERRSPHGEVPERLNGRDWKSRDGGNLVRGFESLPLRL